MFFPTNPDLAAILGNRYVDFENVEIWEPENLEIRNLEKYKNKISQNKNPCRPKCRQGLD